MSKRFGDLEYILRGNLSNGRTVTLYLAVTDCMYRSILLGQKVRAKKFALIIYVID